MYMKWAFMDSGNMFLSHTQKKIARFSRRWEFQNVFFYV